APSVHDNQLGAAGAAAGSEVELRSDTHRLRVPDDGQAEERRHVVPVAGDELGRMVPGGEEGEGGGDRAGSASAACPGEADGAGTGHDGPPGVVASAAGGTGR